MTCVRQGGTSSCRIVYRAFQPLLSTTALIYPANKRVDDITASLPSHPAWSGVAMEARDKLQWFSIVAALDTQATAPRHGRFVMDFPHSRVGRFIF